MNVVIDANILMSALISIKGKTFDLIFNDKITLFTPDFLFEEIKKHETLILKKSGLSKSDFAVILSLVSSRIETISKEEFSQHILKAQEVSPDNNDKQYFALALHLQCFIWTNDKELKKQEIVRIVNTQELIKIL